MISARNVRLLLQNRSRLQTCCFYGKDAPVKTLHAPSNVIIDHESKFGSLANAATLELNKDVKILAPQKFKTLEELEDDDGESEHYAKISDTSRLKPRDFEIKIEDLLSRRELSRALEVFDDEMLEERVKPNIETFKLLIHACGKAGYAYKAGELLSRYRSGGNSATYGMFANTFHACANAPAKTKEASLKIAHGCKTSLLRQSKSQLPLPLYNTMVAAFGRCGDIETAFSIIDEMQNKRVVLECRTFDHLLQACISDRESGFRLALTVYRRLLNKKCKPTHHTYNLLLKAAKDCGIGDTEDAYDLLVEAMSSKEVRKFKQKLLEEEADIKRDMIKNLGNDKREGNSVELVSSSGSDSELAMHNSKPLPPQLPNLLSNQPVMDFITGLSAKELNSCSNARLQLFGGVDGFIDVVTNEFNVKIDIKTISSLINFVNSDLEEEKLLDHMRQERVKPDIDFFNQLMRRKVERNDYKGAREVLNLVNEYELSPDISTYGCLSLCCKNPSHIYQMMRDLDSNNIIPNVQIMTPLIKSTNDPKLMISLLKFIRRHNITVDAYLVRRVEKFYQVRRKLLVDYESGVIEIDTLQKIAKSFAIKKDIENGLPIWKDFCSFYKKWQIEAEITLSEHPWNQFKTKRDKNKGRKH